MTALFRLIVTALAALAACLALPAQARPAPRAAAAAVRPALWKLSDADTTIYLFGTIHALPKGVNWFNGEVARAFNGSDELVTEILQSGGGSAGAATLAKALLPQGQTLRGLMSQAQRGAYEKALTDLGLKNDSFDRFEPWYAAVALSTLPLLRAGYAADNGVDVALDARAAAAKRRHVALETMEFQLGLFDGLPMDVQVRYLAEIVEHMPTLRSELTEMVAQWRAGNAAKLAELMNADEDDPVLVERLILARNRTWAQWIKTRMERPGTVFLAVGAGHLAGKGSVQEQLAALGFTTSRVQ
jgi:uncharacterized protein YbaP (TraB family)